MTKPDRDTAAYALHYLTAPNESPEGLPAPDFIRIFFYLCDAATDEQLQQLSLSYPELVAAHRLMFSAEGIDVLRALANPSQT